MTYFFNDNLSFDTYLEPLEKANDFLLVGWEYEVNNINPDRMKEILIDNDLDFLRVVSELTTSNGCEILFPLLPFDQLTLDLIKRVMDIVENNNGTTDNCGGHFHISVKKVVGINSNSYFHKVLEHFKAHVSRCEWNTRPTWYTEYLDVNRMDDILICDIFYRYSLNNPIIDKLLPHSRRGSNNTYCPSIASLATRLENATTLRQLNDLNLNRKYNALTLSSIDEKGTIECRQMHSTCNIEKLKNFITLILNMIYTSDHSRLVYNGEPEQLTIPNNPFRNATRKAVMWDILTERPTMTSDLMIETGMDAQNIRSRISEIRDRFDSDNIVTTANQQQNNYSYGSGETNSGYFINLTYTKRNQRATVERVPSNRIANPSIWYLVTDTRFEYSQLRMGQLS